MIRFLILSLIVLGLFLLPLFIQAGVKEGNPVLHLQFNDGSGDTVMEAIGGTGDTMTGVLSVLCGADFKLMNAAVLAARVNRWTGYYADPNPATQVSELIEKIPQALIKVLNEHNGKDTKS